MSALKWLKYLLLLENLLGIYRNYYSQKMTKKCYIIFHIFVQTVLHFFIVFGELYLLLIADVYNLINYIYCDFVTSSYITSLITVVTGISNSRAFASYIQSICRVSKWFEDDKKYINSLKKLYWFSISFILVSIAFAALRSLDIIMNFKPKDYEAYEFLCVPIFLSQTLIRITILFQKIMLFVCIMIVVNLSKCLDSLISAVQERVKSCYISSDEQCDITREQIQGWVELYRDLADCCENLTLCFGRQFFFSLIMSISYYILLTYQMCYLSVLNEQDKKIAIVIIWYVFLTILPIVAGQLAHNQGLKFHRVLARLYNTITIFDLNEAEAKLIKDFIRLIKKNPIEIRLLSNIPAGMYMLPVILMSTVNYIIVMLQFSNIV